MTGSHHLLDHLVLFGRYLRALGIPVTPRQVTTLAEALAHIDLANWSDFQASAQAILVTRQEHIAPFRQAFYRFWQRPADPLRQEASQPFPFQPTPVARFQAPLVSRPLDLPPLLPDQDETTADRTATYSARELLRTRDFGQLTLAELAEVRRLILATRWQLPQRRTRRARTGGRGQSLDMRSTWRYNLRHGGEILDLRRRRRQRKPRPLVLLCDVSGSMERYARILLQLAYGLSRQAGYGTTGPVEVFVFGTRLTRLTHHLSHGNADQALAAASAAIHDWGGGTRIGEALKRFNYDWARRVLRHGAIVLIISDGIDRGDVALMARETARLQRSCHRLIWLNPLLGSEGYQPAVRGMQAALPFVDEFLPVHNLASAEQLWQRLQADR
jgi:uncharacterized protein with von Willebrand factor type A (vWA) domain